MKFSTIMMLLVCVAALFALSHAQAGVTTSINMGALNNLISTILPRVLEAAKATQIPNVDSGHKHIENIHITGIGVNEFGIGADPAGWINLRVHRFFAHTEMKFRYHHRFVKYHCGVTAKLDNCNIAFDAQFFNNGGSPGINIGNIGVDCGDASIHLHGNLIAKLVNALKDLFKSKIRHAIINGVRGAVHSGLEGFARAMSGSLTLRTAISNWGSMDLSLLEGVGYDGNSVTVHFNGEVQRADDLGWHSSQPRFPTNFGPNGSLFSVAVSTFVFNSAFEAFTVLGRWNHGYDAGNPGAFAPFINTAAYKDFFPAVYQKFPDQNMSYTLAMEGVPQLTAQGGVASFAATPLLHVNADGGHVFTIRLNLSSGVSIALINQEGWRIIPQIQGLNVAFNVVDSAVGDIDVNVINGILSIALDIAASVINGQMIQGVSIPSVNGMQLTDPQFVITDNTFIANTGIHFDI